MIPEVVGWAASVILIATLGKQIHTQLKEDVKGVSRWLFAGQIAASAGFIAYSWMLDNLVFITTNSLVLLTAVIGQTTLFMRRRRCARTGERPLL